MSNKVSRGESIPVSIHGLLKTIEPAKERFGCVLHVNIEGTISKYYVPFSVQYCHYEFPEGSNITFKMDENARPDENGIYNIAANSLMLA